MIGKSTSNRGSRSPSRTRVDLTAPRRQGIRLGVHYDPEDFGRFSEGIARFIGTARFLVYQTVVVAAWLGWNTLLPKHLRFDKPPYIGLTLVLSLQAAYAAPLILLAQNRQELRDRRANERDREVAGRTQADTEFLARELASIRLALSDVATVDELQKAIDRVVRKRADDDVTRELTRESTRDATRDATRAADRTVDRVDRDPA
jgi:uncharacterized membrane protein